RCGGRLLHRRAGVGRGTTTRAAGSTNARGACPAAEVRGGKGCHRALSRRLPRAPAPWIRRRRAAYQLAPRVAPDEPAGGSLRCGLRDWRAKTLCLRRRFESGTDSVEGIGDEAPVPALARRGLDALPRDTRASGRGHVYRSPIFL